MDDVDIIVLCKPECVQCHYTKEKLTEYRVPFFEADVSTDHNARDLAASTGFTTAPIVVVRDTAGVIIDTWAGFKIEKIRGLKRYARKQDSAAS